MAEEALLEQPAAVDAPPSVEDQARAMESVIFQNDLMNNKAFAVAPPQPTAQQAQPAAPPPPEDEYEEVDPSELGFTDWASLKDAFIQLKTKADAPAPAVTAPQFANETSKNYADYLLAGEEDKLYQSLHARQQIKGVETMSDEQKLKLFIRLNNPLYTPKLIEAVYERDYGHPSEDKFKDSEGNLNSLLYELAQVDAEQKKQKDTRNADEFFANYKTKIDLSPIQPQAPQDPDYEAFKASKSQQAEIEKRVQEQIIPAINAVTEQDAPLGFQVNDPSNQMQFDVVLAIEKGDLDDAKKSAVNFDGWVANTFYDKNGNFLQSKFVSAIALINNYGKYAQSIARQAVNAERRHLLNKETPIVPIEKQFDLAENDQLKKLEQNVFNPGMMNGGRVR